MMVKLHEEQRWAMRDQKPIECLLKLPQRIREANRGDGIRQRKEDIL